MAEIITISPGDWEKIKKAQRRLSDLILECDRCEQVGIPMDQARQALKDLMDQTQRIEQVYGSPSLGRTSQPHS